MSGPIFPNRLAALAIVALTLAAVASLVGTGENEGTLSTATQALAEKAAQSSGKDTQPPEPAQAAKLATTPPAPTAAPAAPPIVAGGFADEESLIDDASGFDPSPESDDPALGEVVAIVEEVPTEEPAAPVVIEEP